MNVTALKMLTSEVQAAYAADQDYLDAHFDEWLEKYPEQWVVVKDCALILASPNEMDVLAVVERHGGTVVVDRMQPRRSVHAVTER